MPADPFDSDDGLDPDIGSRVGEHVRGTCRRCGAPCTSVTEDRSVGNHEHGYDERLVELSPCCGDVVVPEQE